jgi:Family of unknown function (DUF5628)/Domain of unknown function (DUF5593)
MAYDWLLVETLGSEPVVVAHGIQTKDLVPVTAYLRRNPHLMAIQTAIAETVRGGQPLSSITPKNDRVIRTEVVQMSDGAIHGVHLWIGPPDVNPPERPLPGPLKWDLTSGIATDTPQSLANLGLDPETEETHGRAFIEDLPTRDVDPSQDPMRPPELLPEPGATYCSTWDLTDFRGEPITVGFCARALTENQDDGRDRLICRAMNWRSEREGHAVPVDYLPQRILNGLTQSGVHRALVDTDDWKLLKWLDEPADFYDWRSNEIHPDDGIHLARMILEYDNGATSAVMRMRTDDGDWIPVHVTMNRIELEPGTFAGLAAVRLPTDDELTAAHLDGPEPVEAKPRKGKVLGRRRHR